MRPTWTFEFRFQGLQVTNRRYTKNLEIKSENESAIICKTVETKVWMLTQ
jgi:hypothetical protein